METPKKPDYQRFCISLVLSMTANLRYQTKEPNYRGSNSHVLTGHNIQSVVFAKCVDTEGQTNPKRGGSLRSFYTRILPTKLDEKVFIKSIP